MAMGTSLHRIIGLCKPWFLAISGLNKLKPL